MKKELDKIGYSISMKCPILENVICAITAYLRATRQIDWLGLFMTFRICLRYPGHCVNCKALLVHYFRRHAVRLDFNIYCMNRGFYTIFKSRSYNE